MALARGIGSNKSTSSSDTDPIPMRILEERLARGEIDVEEYQARLRATRQTRF
jgi:uncharacterized membrane protein